MDASPKAALSPHLLDALLGSVGEIVFVLDGQGQVRGASRGVLERTGLEQEALAGHPWPELCRPSEEARDILNDLGRDEGPAYFQTRLIGAEQAIRPVVLSVQRFGAEPDGGYLVFGYDLERSPGDALREDATQLAARVNRLQESLLTVNRQLGETALQLAEEQQKMKAVMASLGEGMLVLDPERRIVQAGGTTEELLGLARTELLGRKAEAIVPELFQALERTEKACSVSGSGGSMSVSPNTRPEFVIRRRFRAIFAPGIGPEGNKIKPSISPHRSRNGHFLLGICTECPRRYPLTHIAGPVSLCRWIAASAFAQKRCPT